MSETLSLHEYVTKAINLYLRKNGGGIPNGFIYAVNYIDIDGVSNTEIGCMDEQSPLLSAGLNQYLNVVCDAWVQDELFCCEDEDID